MRVCDAVLGVTEVATLDSDIVRERENALCFIEARKGLYLAYNVSIVGLLLTRSSN